MRSAPSWVGKTDDAPVPPRVKLRIWERCEGRCALTGRKLRPGDAYDFDHIVALANGGAHAEQNLQLVSREAHRAKTAEDVAERARVDRIRKKHLGIKSKSGRSLTHPFLKRRFDGTVERREEKRRAVDPR